MNTNKITNNKKELIKKFSLSDFTKQRIDKEIENLKYLREGIYKNIKEIELATIINVIIDKRIVPFEKKENKENFLKNEDFANYKEKEQSEVKLNLSSSKIFNSNKENNVKSVQKCLPDFINFVIVLDCTYPIKPPKLLMKTNITFPSLVDGSNLINELIPNWESENISLLDIINKLPAFLLKIIFREVLQIYGSYVIGSIYDIKNFYSMSVNIFNCSIEKENENGIKEINQKRKDKKKKQPYIFSSEKIVTEVTMILTDNSLLIFEPLEYDKKLSKLIFWSLLFSIKEIVIINKEKNLIIRIFDDSKNIDGELKLRIENILLFKEALTRRMNKLRITGESQKILNGNNVERRLTDKDINNMTIDELIKNFKYFDNILKQRIFTFYNINSYFNITKKIVEYHSARNDQNHLFYLHEMKDLLENEEVKRIFNNY